MHTRNDPENPQELAFELNLEVANLIVLTVFLVIIICELQLNYVVLHIDH